MQRDMKLIAKDVALTICFTSLYALFCLFPLFKIVGLPTKSITMAAIIAPIIGILLGPYLGALSTFLGGSIGFFAVHFNPLSLVSGIVTAVFAGMLYAGKRSVCAFMYFSLLFLFGFYPFVGPVWLYSPLMWFQIIGFLILVSPLQSMALKDIRISKNDSRFLLAFLTLCLTSTLAGQIAGSLTFELISWPIFNADVNAWTVSWQLLTWVYPVERMIIALIATFIGVVLYKVLTSANLLSFFSRTKQS